MENKNIYKLDDFLIILSLILLVPAVFFAWPFLKGFPDASDIAVYFQSAPAVLGNQLLYVLSYLVGALLTQIAGRIIRYQEKLSLKILEALGYSGKGRVSEVSTRLGMSEAKVRKLVQKLSRVNSLNISLEGDRIIRSREPVKKAAEDYSDQFPGDMKKDAKEEGEEDFDSRMEQLKENGTVKNLKSQGIDLASAMEEMKKSGAKPGLKNLHQLVKAASTDSQSSTPKDDRNSDGEDKPFGCLGMGILVFLFLTPLWPIPLVIFIRKAVKQRGMSSKEV